MALEFMREIIACTESSPALRHPIRVGSATRCQVSPGKVAGAGCAAEAIATGVAFRDQTRAAVAMIVARGNNRVRRIVMTKERSSVSYFALFQRPLDCAQLRLDLERPIRVRRRRLRPGVVLQQDLRILENMAGQH